VRLNGARPQAYYPPLKHVGVACVPPPRAGTALPLAHRPTAVNNVRAMKKKSEIPTGWRLISADKALASELRARLPDRLFDVHMHPYRRADIRPPIPFLQAGPAKAGYAAWRKYVGALVGARRLRGALLTPYPSREGDVDVVNDFVAAELKRAPSCAASIVIGPNYPRAKAEERLKNPRIRCMKPYHLLARRPSGGQASRSRTFDCTIEEYLPGWAWKLAEERGLVILLHMVRDAALSDSKNLASIIRLCERHPNARLLLAHAARGFCAPNTIRSVSKLVGLQNVWFDSSGICEPDALAAILSEFGPRRLLWGTDFPVSHQRGRCVTLGTGFCWVVTDQVEWNEKAFFGQPVVVGLESLRALLRAADYAFLNEGDLQDVFCDNALRLLAPVGASLPTTTAAPVGASLPTTMGAPVGAPSTSVQELYREAKELLPGGTQLLSKRPEMFAPGQWPAYFREARGCEIWDIDGRHYWDVGIHGIGACLLGFRDPDVTRAVQRRVALGSYSTLNPPDEVDLAKLLCELHPWAEQVRYARTGGEMMAVAVRIARATTDRSAVAICGYHGWHDWYLAANLGESDALRGHLLPGLDPLGVPRELRGTNLPFTYNNRDELERIIRDHGHRLAAIVMEPCRNRDPEPGFLEFVRDQAHRVGALLIFDEITIGWRLAVGGAHLKFGVTPDIAAFAKTMSNGYPMAAVIGTREAMEGAHTSFISSSYWTEGVGPAAALATVRKMRELNLPAHCERIGRKVMNAWSRSAGRHGLPVKVDDGYPALAHFSFEPDGERQPAHELAAELKTLYVQSMLERGFLATLAIYVTLAHTDEVVEMYAKAIDEVFAELAEALERGEVKKRLKGPVAHTGFRRLL